MRTALASLFLAACLAPPARADVVYLTDGRVIEGLVEDQGDHVLIARRLGGVRVPLAEVLRIERRETPEQELARRVLELKPGDVAAALDLARFCLDHDFEEEARALARHIEREAPLTEGLAEVWTRLDHHLVDGEWVAPEDYYPTRGWERQDGRWMPPEEVRLVRASRARRDAEGALERARRAADDGERAAALAASGVEAAQADAERLERRGPMLDALRAGAEATLRAREDDLRFAEESALDARRRYDGWVVVVREGDGRWETQRVLLLESCSRNDRDVKRARKARDEALAALQQLVEEAARLPDLLATARADLRRAGDAAAAARAAAEGARAALGEAEAHRARVEQELKDARTARDAARAGR